MKTFSYSHASETIILYDTDMKEKILYTLSMIGFLMIAGSMIVPLVEGPYYDGSWYKYLYAAGALLMLIGALFSPFKGKDLRLKRLFRLQSISAIMFCVAAFFLFWPGATLRDWIAITLAAAVVRAYTNFAIVARQRKLASDEKK